MSKTVLKIVVFDRVMLNKNLAGGMLEIDFTSYLARAVVFLLSNKTRAMTAGTQWMQVQIQSK